MIPTTDLIYNYDYARRLYHGDENFEEVWQRVIRIGGDFEAIYEECIDAILESIARYSGFGWQEYAEDFLPIYLADSGSSFVHPLTITVDENPKTMLEDFICQLTHRNMYFGFKDDKSQDKCLRLVTDQILEDLDVKKEGKQDWDLNQKTIKEYLNK